MTSDAATLRLTVAEQFWYVLQCLAFGAGYFAKIPVKKAFSEVGLAEMTNAEKFWYVLQCLAFGAGYFAKIPVKRALTDLTPIPGGYANLESGQGTVPQLGQAHLGVRLEDRPGSAPLDEQDNPTDNP